MNMDVYISCDRNTKVSKKIVTLGDIGALACSDAKICEALKNLVLLQISSEKSQNYILTALDVIRTIHIYDNNLIIHLLGKTDFIIEYTTYKKDHTLWEYGRTLFVGLAIFIGSAFTIIAFDNDIGINIIFEQVYYQFTGQKSDGFTVIELSYSIGLGVGILLFYNHYGTKRKEKDPTPLQVEMRLYEADVNTAIIENKNREGKNTDA